MDRRRHLARNRSTRRAPGLGPERPSRGFIFTDRYNGGRRDPLDRAHLRLEDPGGVNLGSPRATRSLVGGDSATTATLELLDRRGTGELRQPGGVDRRVPSGGRSLGFALGERPATERGADGGDRRTLGQLPTPQHRRLDGGRHAVVAGHRPGSIVWQPLSPDTMGHLGNRSAATRPGSRNPRDCRAVGSQRLSSATPQGAAGVDLCRNGVVRRSPGAARRLGRGRHRPLFAAGHRQRRAVGRRDPSRRLPLSPLAPGSLRIGCGHGPALLGGHPLPGDRTPAHAGGHGGLGVCLRRGHRPGMPGRGLARPTASRDDFRRSTRRRRGPDNSSFRPQGQAHTRR